MTSLAAGDLTLEIDAEHGGRFSSLRYRGHELLYGSAHLGDPLAWGCYPMVPWAGRVRHGRFGFEGVDYELPLGLGHHAIHGTGYVRPWRWVDADRIVTDLGPDWPFGGRVEQHFQLTPKTLTVTMTVVAERPMPVMAGWHPWFRREVAGVPVELIWSPGAMYELDDDEIPTGRLVPVPPGPWDNCFVDLAAAPKLVWPGICEIELAADVDHWVVYDMPEHALCVEPQSDAPDAFNRVPDVAVPGEPWAVSMTISVREAVS